MLLLLIFFTHTCKHLCSSKNSSRSGMCFGTRTTN